MKALFIFIISFCTCLKAIAQQEYINWDKNVKIEWADFNGKTDNKSPFAAMSAIGIHYKYNCWSNGAVYKLTFEINSRFDKTRSWSRKNFQSSYILQHEQLHFDIAEIVRRKFKWEADHTSYTKDYRSETVNMYNRYMQLLQNLQQRYDSDTQHSRNRVKQKVWENLINRELEKHE